MTILNNIFYLKNALSCAANRCCSVLLNLFRLPMLMQSLSLHAKLSLTLPNIRQTYPHPQSIGKRCHI